MNKKPSDSECLQIEAQIRDKLFEIFQIDYGSITSFSDTHPSTPVTFIVDLKSTHEDFLNSPYNYYKNSFVHFTRPQAAIEIITSLKHRMYNLYSKDDNQEYKYASAYLGRFHQASDRWLMDIKKQKNEIINKTFILSATTPENISKMWNEVYSNYGQGVALEYGICNDYRNCNGFFLTKVQYGGEDKFKRMQESLEKISKKYPLCVIKLNLNEIIPFHKEPIEKWIGQKEVRLMTFSSRRNELRIMCHENDPQRKFIELPIFGKFIDEDLIQQNIPVLRLNYIHLGPKTEKSTRSKLEPLLKGQFDHPIKIKQW